VKQAPAVRPPAGPQKPEGAVTIAEYYHEFGEAGRNALAPTKPFGGGRVQVWGRADSVNASGYLHLHGEGQRPLICAGVPWDILAGLRLPCYIVIEGRPAPGGTADSSTSARSSRRPAASLRPERGRCHDTQSQPT
jgi:hypothetical protein